MNPTLLPAGTQIPVALGISTVLPSMDFETYSEAGFAIDPHTGKVRGVGPQGKGGLGVVGTPVYAEHPSTEVICLYYDLKDGRGRRGWAPALPGFPEGLTYLPAGDCIQFGDAPHDLLEYVASGGLIEAWNATFEYWIWNMVCVKRYGWPVLRRSQCRCAMAKSRRHSLPGALGKAAQVLGTAEKDKEGNRLIQKLCRPITPTKARPHHRWTQATAWEDFTATYRYCDRDVETEDCAAACIPDLTPDELRTWQLDQTINARGVQVDICALDACLEILGQTERKYTEELQRITDYKVFEDGTRQGVKGISEVAKLGEWLREQGVNLPDMTKDTVADALKRTDLPDHAYRALEIRAVLGAANVKKLRTLKLQVNSDGRLRDQYTYCGADRTGRASAGGVQLQNITSKGPKTAMCESCEMIFGYGDHLMTDGGYYCPRCNGIMWHVLNDWTVEGVEFALADIGMRDLDWVERVWGDPIALLCGCLRGLFIAKEGHELICVDFSAVEAVVAACLSRCQWRIDVFNTHAKIYEMSAAKITGTSFEEIVQHKVDNGHDHPLRKTVGKVAELASGYGGWIGAWKNFGADAFMSDDEIKDAVLKWRDESPEIVEMWGGQFRWCGPGKWDYRPELFGLEGCAINAILNPGQCFSYIDITYAVYENILFCRLPSGRFLKYHRPRLAPITDKLNRGPAVQIVFEGYNTNSQKGPIGWHVMETYSGRLFENCVQAVAADIQFEGLARCDERNYPIVMHTHDEGSAEVPIGVGSVEEMAEIMTERPKWASWWPLRAAGWRHKRYQKD